MSDKGEGPPVSQAESRPQYKFEGSLGRDLKLLSVETKALDLSWPNGIIGRRVDFPQPDGKLVWGVEIEIPLRFEGVKGIYEHQFRKFAEEGEVQVTDKEVQSSVDRHQSYTWLTHLERFGIPDRIAKVRILDLAPQENLPRPQRNIDSKRDWWHDMLGNKSPVRRLTGQSPEGKIIDRAMWALSMPSITDGQRSEALHDLLYDVFGEDEAGLARFKESIEKSQGDEILMVHAHGGYDNIIGEQNLEVKGKDAEIQAGGNRIDLAQIIDRYDQPEKYGAILINTCYLGNENPPVKRVPVFRPRGLTTGNRGGFWPSRNKLLVSEPSK